MDVHAALEEVARWCAQQTAAGTADELEVDCHATVWITIAEAAPPWQDRWDRRCTAGASSPVAQLRYDLDSREWALHHRGQSREPWCCGDDALRDVDLGPLLHAIAGDRGGRFRGLGPDYRWPRGVAGL